MAVQAVVDKFRRLYPNIEDVKAQFNSYDANKDGNISAEEMEAGMTANKDFTRDQAKYAFELADTNGDGEIDISEFVQLMFPTAQELIANLRKNFKGPADVERRFKSWDVNGDGKISFDEMKEAMKNESKITEEDINAIFVMGDMDLDGEVDFKEFSTLMVPTVSDVVAKFRMYHKNVKDVRGAFRKFDKNGDGSIDKAELSSALTGYHFMYSDQEVDIVFDALDVDGDGEITYEEFVNLMCPDAAAIIKKFRKTYKNITEVKAAFKKFDKNRDGTLSKSEMSRVMFSTGYSFSDVEVDAIMNLGDADGDGSISLEEFVGLMSPSASDVLVKLRGNYKTIDDVKEAFKAIDTDGDGLLSKEEVMTAPGNKFDAEEVNAIFELGDADGDDNIDMGEFIGIMFPSAGEVIAKLSKKVPNIDQVKELFRSLDVDNDGHITKAEVAEHGQNFTPNEVEAIFGLGDVNDDGILDLEEFIGVMYPSASTVVQRLKAKFSNLNDVKKAFASIDVNGDFKISREEMAESDAFNNQEIDALFTLGDANNDGEIDLEEFIGVLYPVLAKALAKFTKNITNIDDARFMFRQLDKDHDGLLSQEEMRANARFSPVELEALFALGDINNDGEIDENEFINVMCPAATTVIARIASNYKTTEEISHAFHLIDVNHDGKISQEEMAEFSGLNEQEVTAVFALADADNDGEIDLNEFVAAMTTASAVPYTESGSLEQVGDLTVYTVGEGAKGLIWCSDVRGFSGADRSRQLADKLALEGYRIIMPDFFRGDYREPGSADKAWLADVSNWGERLRDDWIETLLPWVLSQGIQVLAVLGTGWGSYMANRLSAYSTDVVAGVSLQPSTSEVVAATGEDLYEVLEEVACPQLVIAAGDDSEDFKQDGLAYRIWKSMWFGKKCEFKEYTDMSHGWITHGDRAVEKIAVACRISINMVKDFLDKHLHYEGEPVPEPAVVVKKSRKEEDIDLNMHSSNACPTCIEIRHQAEKASCRSF